ncbi:MAG TPA: ribonuclease Z [Candidatus Deferrimicrobium sp.]|nr:ribonuclease Z [Candidatus Deferrimicrobium sp.]
MKIILLGTGTTLPQKNRNAAGLLIQIFEDFLLFDCGNGILRQIENSGVDFTKIKFIFISHLHVDHISDLPILLKAILMRGELNNIKIFGPSTIKRRIEVWFTEIYSYLNKILKKIEIEEFNQNLIETRNWKVQVFPVKHGIEAFGFKIIVDNKKIVYSGDTGFCEELIEAAKNADILIHECSYPTALGKEGHTTPLEVGQIANRSEVKKLVLTHFYPECSGQEHEILNDIKKMYNGEVFLGQDLQDFEL